VKVQLVTLEITYDDAIDDPEKWDWNHLIKLPDFFTDVNIIYKGTSITLEKDGERYGKF